MDLLKEIGAILGFVAFGGMAVLAFLTFQQARHVRRLREWAGRSPERAAVEAERVAEAASEATIARRGGYRDEGDEEERPARGPEVPGRVHRLRGELAYRWEELDNRSPVDPKILLAGLLAVLIGVGILTSGFGLLGGSDESPSPAASGGAGKAGETGPSEVVVLNGTATSADGTGAVAGVADTASGFVEEAGFEVSDTDDSPAPFGASVVMFDGDDAKSDAKDLAAALEEQLGALEVVEMDPEVEEVAGKAKIALVVGGDDAGI